MARPISDNSVSTVVGLLMVNHQVTIQGKSLPSVTVMVSQLKSKPQHKDKKFKIKQQGGLIIVTRVL
jgi:hypothetical protein